MKAKKGFWIACGIFTFLAFYLGARLTLIYRGLPNQARPRQISRGRIKPRTRSTDREKRLQRQAIPR